MTVHEEICLAIDGYKDKAVDISHQIHEHPELKFQERFAAELLGKALAALGFRVESGIAGMATAFRASFGRQGPTIAIMAEYDALPNGHSCGHNLIAGAALAAFVGLAKLQEKIPGRMMIFGTPAEEGGGGKIVLLKAGEMQGVDAAMMAHPSDSEFSTMPALATQHLQFVFTGRAAHAAAAPWDGASALSAVLHLFHSVDAARIHFRDRSRIHGIITDGGQAVNIIPKRAACEFLARARSSRRVIEMAERVARCAQAAASATGTKVEQRLIMGYKNMINNRTMASRYEQHSQALGAPIAEAPETFPTGSTDMGDVSHEMPAIHPTFRIADTGAGTCHEDAFEKYADTPRAYEAMIGVAKTMAMTAYDLIAEPSLLEAAKQEWEQRRER
jgi:amidohydrolase